MGFGIAVLGRACKAAVVSLMCVGVLLGAASPVAAGENAQVVVSSGNGVKVSQGPPTAPVYGPYRPAVKVSAGWNWYVLYSRSQTRLMAKKIGEVGALGALSYGCYLIPVPAIQVVCGVVGGWMVTDMASTIQDAARNNRCFQVEIAYTPVVPIDWYTHTCEEN